MEIREIFKTVFAHALKAGIVKDDLSFEEAMKMQCDNYDGCTEEELFEMFANGEYWHALQILDYAAPSAQCSYFLDSIQDEDGIKKFVKKLEATTSGAWMLSEINFEHDGNSWKLKLVDNFGSTVIPLPDEEYLVAEEVVIAVQNYINSLPLHSSITVRGANYQSAYFLSHSLKEKLDSSGVLDQQGDPASEFY